MWIIDIIAILVIATILIIGLPIFIVILINAITGKRR